MCFRQLRLKFSLNIHSYLQDLFRCTRFSRSVSHTVLSSQDAIVLSEACLIWRILHGFFFLTDVQFVVLKIAMSFLVDQSYLKTGKCWTLAFSLTDKRCLLVMQWTYLDQ